MAIELGKVYEVRTIKLLPFGVIVELPDKSTELVHISNLSDKFVKHVEDVVSVDRIYHAVCVQGQKKIELSFKAYKPKVDKPKKSFEDMLSEFNKSYEENHRNDDRFFKRERRRGKRK